MVFDLTEVGFVKRFTVGGTDPAKLPTEEENDQTLAKLNRCLTEAPKGHIIGMEKNFAVLNIGEHQVVLQSMVYHVGFSRKPYWLE